MALEIIWNKQALEHITKVIEWISQEPIVQAEQVEEAILGKVEELAKNPERYSPDKFKTNNNGSY